MPHRRSLTAPRPAAPVPAIAPDRDATRLPDPAGQSSHEPPPEFGMSSYALGARAADAMIDPADLYDEVDEDGEPRTCNRRMAQRPQVGRYLGRGGR